MGAAGGLAGVRRGYWNCGDLKLHCAKGTANSAWNFTAKLGRCTVEFDVNLTRGGHSAGPTQSTGALLPPGCHSVRAPVVSTQTLRQKGRLA